MNINSASPPPPHTHPLLGTHHLRIRKRTRQEQIRSFLPYISLLFARLLPSHRRDSARNSCLAFQFCREHRVFTHQTARIVMIRNILVATSVFLSTRREKFIFRAKELEAGRDRRYMSASRGCVCTRIRTCLNLAIS